MGQIDEAAARALFARAFSSLDGADRVAVMERALDLVCQMLRRQSDQPLRERAAGLLAGRLEGAGQGDDWRDAAEQVIAMVAAERVASPPAPPPPGIPGRRVTDP